MLHSTPVTFCLTQIKAMLFLIGAKFKVRKTLYGGVANTSVTFFSLYHIAGENILQKECEIVREMEIGVLSKVVSMAVNVLGRLLKQSLWKKQRRELLKLL